MREIKKERIQQEKEKAREKQAFQKGMEEIHVINLMTKFKDLRHKVFFKANLFITDKTLYINMFRAHDRDTKITECKKEPLSILTFFTCIGPNNMTDQEYSTLWLNRAIYLSKVNNFSRSFIRERIEDMEKNDRRTGCFAGCTIF